jgi:hypothetical protein
MICSISYERLNRGKVTIRNGWLRKPSKKQGFRNNVNCINHKKQGFRIDFWQDFRIIIGRGFVSFFTEPSYQVYRAFVTILTGSSYRSYRVFVTFLQGYRNVKAFNVIFSQMLLTGFHIETSDISKL